MLRCTLSMRRLLSSILFSAALIVCLWAGKSETTGTVPRADGTTFAALGDAGLATLRDVYYSGHGLWRDCPQPRCWIHNNDWGSDALTATIALRYATRHDDASATILDALAHTARTYPRPCTSRERCLLWSDAPLWDAVADMQEAAAAHDRIAIMQTAKRAFWAVEGSSVYGVGACPTIRYQRPLGRGDHLKTLETDANGIKAALLLYQATRDDRYLTIAQKRYAAARRYFFDPMLRLYSVYVFDDGRSCIQLRHRFFASVNGLMIDNGLTLARVTGVARYREEALATATAVALSLNDERGVFADLQAENDIGEPLVEAMLHVALCGTQASRIARAWIITNAEAAVSARRPDGSYGRFFDGPPPLSPATAWQTNGGIALQIAAATLVPHRTASSTRWRIAEQKTHTVFRVPATISVRGNGFALIGEIGERCCQFGHVRVVVDGVETTNRTGIWQNKSSSGQRLPGSVLFAWRWKMLGDHHISFLPAVYNEKEGGTFLHARGYEVIGDP